MNAGDPSNRARPPRRRARRAATKVGLFFAGAAVAGVLAASNPAALLADTTALITDASATTAQTTCPTATDPVTGNCPATSTDPTTTGTTTTETTPTATTPETVATTPPPETTSSEPAPSANADPVAATPPTTTTQGNSAKPTSGSGSGSGWHPGMHSSKSSTKGSAAHPKAGKRQDAAHKQAAAKKRAAAKAKAKAKAEAKAKAAQAPKVQVPFGLTVQLPKPPSFLVRTYRQAGRRYDVPWKILAAINGIETGYGANLNVSSAGAVGWMQFLPSTWSIYGNGGNPYDPHDSIFAAARLLHAAGASTDLPAAIYAYNHADWYVAAVLWQAGNMDSRGRTTKSTHGYALPLDARYMAPLGRTDDGIDIENAPDGAPVYSMTPGIVTSIASDPAGFGPNYPVVLVTDGPLAGRYIYYGHVAASLVQQGQTVKAGEPLAIMGHTGDAASLAHGHIEIGFSDGSGTPLEQHGVEAWTASGQAMRGVMTSLMSDAGIKVDQLKRLKLSRATLVKISQLRLH